MQRYIIRRLLLAIPTLLMVSFLVFGLMRILPGDALVARVQEAGYINDETAAIMRREMGLDKPLVQQFGSWLWSLAQGDLGTSLYARVSTASRLGDAIPVSVELALLSVVFGVALALPLGVVSAVYQDRWIDHAARLFAIIGIAMPNFWVGTMVILYLSLVFGYLPPMGYTPIWEDPARNIQQFVLPAAVLGLRLSASTTRMTRAAMLEVLRQDYVRTARSKGLSGPTVLWRHALKNAMLPVVTIVGTQFAFLLGGTVIMETLFSLPGVGLLTFQSIGWRDYTQLQANVLFFSGALVLMNLLVDTCYSLLDPRIRYQ